jgi:hypothetical protein
MMKRTTRKLLLRKEIVRELSRQALSRAPHMSPEQWRDPHGVGPATDIYALGFAAEVR